MFHFHTLYLDGIAVAEVEIRVEPWLTWAEGLVLDLFVEDLDGAEWQICNRDLEQEILVAHEETLYELAHEKDLESAV